MPFVIRIVGIALSEGATFACAESGKYVADYRPDLCDGRGVVATSREIAKAKFFDNQSQALAFYRTQSRTRPLRDDGGVNRPLTAFTVELVAVEPETMGS